MLIESTWIRDLLSQNVSDLESAGDYSAEMEREELQHPKTYKFSLNPIPALVIMLLGIMMSSHHQESMTSTMVHAQWGNLLLGASFARGLTYVIMYIRPPKSVYPSRPPTELLAAFGLIAGGIIFMASVSYIFPLANCRYPVQDTNTPTEQRYCRRHDPLRARCHVHVHRHHGPGGHSDGLGVDCPCHQRLGPTQGTTRVPARVNYPRSTNLTYSSQRGAEYWQKLGEAMAPPARCE